MKFGSRPRRGALNRSWRYGIYGLFFLGAAWPASGCSTSACPSLGTVSGTLTLDGRPLAAATVLFTPEGRGRTSCGTTDSEGRYRLTFLRDMAGATVGRHTVWVTTATEENGNRETLPDAYHARTTLDATVVLGRNSFDFALLKQPR